MLWVRGVKAYYDGSLGSRGARLLADYSDRPGHRGVSGDEYGFPEELVTRAIRAGFQVGVHAIGDAGNRAVLDYYERVLADTPGYRSTSVTLKPGGTLAIHFSNWLRTIFLPGYARLEHLILAAMERQFAGGGDHPCGACFAEAGYGGNLFDGGPGKLCQGGDAVFGERIGDRGAFYYHAWPEVRLVT